MVNSKRRGNLSKRSRVRGKAKRIRKSVQNRAKSTEVVYHSTKEIKVERALIENFIGLQKVMLSLSAKFDFLSSQISKLLELFEASARSLARKELSPSGELDSSKVMEKLDHLSAQAGLIGKGLALIHEVGTEREKPIIPLNIQKNQPLMPSSPIKNLQITEPAPKMTKEIGSEKPINTRGKGIQNVA